MGDPAGIYQPLLLWKNIVKTSLEAAGSGAHLDVSRLFLLYFLFNSGFGGLWEISQILLVGVAVWERQGVKRSWNFLGENLGIQGRAWQQGKKVLVFWVPPPDRAESGLSLPA